MKYKHMASGILLAILTISLATITLGWATPTVEAAPPDIVFVARAHLATKDDIFRTETGPAGQFGSGLPKFAPGSKLMIRRSNGTLVTLVDGSAPAAATGNLIDVQMPDVSFDGTKLIFAGATTVDRASAEFGWRLYEIGVNGTGFRKLPIPDRPFTSVPNNNPNGYNFGNFETYGWWNDLSPAYLADGRIVFASSRWPSRSNYDARHSYNLYVVNADGTGLRRITNERGGLLHPTPLRDGRILVARWWNNFNQPSSKGIYNRIDNQPADYYLADGTLVHANADETFNATTGKLPDGYDIRKGPNAWHLMVVDPDGTDFHRLAFTPYATWARTDDTGLDTYTAAQPALVMSGTQEIIAFTSQQDGSMVHSTHKTGIRVAYPNIDMLYANIGDAIAGLTYQKAWTQDDDSPPYAIHPWGLPDGTILFSYTLAENASLPISGSFTDPKTGRNFTLQGSKLQYSLYTMRPDGSAKTALPTSIGTADAMDAKPIVARTGWSSQTDQFTGAPSDDPRQGNAPNSLPEYPFSQKGPGQIQLATIHNPNIYANPPLSQPFINNSPWPGSIAWADVYIDAPQFTGAYCYGDYPNPCATFKADEELRAAFWTRVPVSLKGEFTAQVPADTPSFIVLRDSAGRVVSGWNRGYISIAQGNAWARPGQTVTCVGCHFGHVSGSIDTVRPDADQGWTNVAPYASVTATSYYATTDPNYQPFVPAKVNDRRGWIPKPTGGPGGEYQDDEEGWISAENRAIGEGLDLTWTTAISVTKVRLVGPPPLGGDWNGFGQYSTSSPYHITGATLRFYYRGAEVGSATVGQIEPQSNGGTLVTLPSPLRMDRLTLRVNSIAGKWHWKDIAALNEIEVVGMAAEWKYPVCANVASPAGVGVEDLQAIAARWGQVKTQAGWDNRYDLDLDGAIRISDIMLASAQWGRSC